MTERGKQKGVQRRPTFSQVGGEDWAKGAPFGLSVLTGGEESVSDGQRKG